MVMTDLNGDIEEAKRMQLQELELVEALFCETNPIPVKHAMNLLNMGAGPLRKPLSPMSSANLERLKKAMKNFGLLQG